MKSHIVFLFLLLLIHSLCYVEGHAGHDHEEIITPNRSNEESSLASGNVGLAFSLTVMSGVASSLGSLLPFIDDLAAKMGWSFRISNSPGFLASSFAFSAGILLFLCLGDLLPEAINHYKISGVIPPQHAQLLATGVFIFGVLSVMLAKRLGSQRKHTESNIYKEDASQNTHNSTDLKQENASDREVITVIEQSDHLEQSTEANFPVTKGFPSGQNNLPPTHIRQNSGEFRALGCQIATALAIHNFPEGLAIFTATLTSSKIGTLFAIALALHKIPEGMMIVLPIYYATGSRWKSFSIAAGIGIVVQILGALLGYLLFVTYWNQAISASLLALAAGILLYTVIGGMIPMARRYDPQDRFVTIWIFLGLWFFSIVAASFSYI